MVSKGRLLACLGILFIVGCGPITATTAIAEATVAIEAARGAQADQFAKYEFTRAQAHLWKAKEEEGYSDFQDAVNLAREAKVFAEKAKARAMARPERALLPKQPQQPQTSPPPATPVIKRRPGPEPIMGESL
ncbi:DUF4398 domain-containing protein [Myxococcota bacterium]|nr:DUF4398 domain-containing protein [Myxococcota bacterium]MBU1429207.1 DUF4398 domain-containing protein [Myxococcota bacterium]MBU1898509.1 DUF4398 domain-containing protein [Myxococcota bacterium]